MNQEYYVKRLPSYLADVPAWVQFAEAMDTVLGETVHQPAQKLANLRDVNNFHPDALAIKQGISILDGTDASYGGVQWNATRWRVQEAMMLGFNFYNIYQLDPTAFDAFIKMAVQFYPEQGTDSWIDFLGFATGAILEVRPLWTNDGYTTMLPEGDPGIGTPVWEGGLWYPTSHVDVNINMVLSQQLRLYNFLDLLNFAAPINLVIRNITVQFAQIQLQAYISMYGWMDIEWGVYGPPISDISASFVAEISVDWL